METAFFHKRRFFLLYNENRARVAGGKRGYADKKNRNPNETKDMLRNRLSVGSKAAKGSPWGRAVERMRD